MKTKITYLNAFLICVFAGIVFLAMPSTTLGQAGSCTSPPNNPPPPPPQVPPPPPCLGCGGGSGGSGGGGGGGGGGSSGTSQWILPGDPNLMTGPGGYGSNAWLSPVGAFAYRIDFENETNASAPAQQVIITDQLSANYDWTSFNVAEFGFGDLVVVLPLGIQQFQTNLPFSYLGSNFQVQIQIGINLTSGLVSAAFRSINPTTSLPPGVNIGFLPPEDGTGRGAGHVTYMIRSKAGLPTGTQLTNVALISFDDEPQIATDQLEDTNPAAGINPALECLITIDTNPPVSSLSTLPATETTTNFTVCWSGTDVGAGIVSYDIYVSTNKGPWTVWLPGATNNCAIFDGINGDSYGFYSVAHDGAGNIEAPPGAAQASTTVHAQIIVSPPLLTITLTGHDVLLAWPTNAGNYLLQTTTNLVSQASWASVTNTPAIIGTSDAVTVPITNTSQFFRLVGQ